MRPSISVGLLASFLAAIAPGRASMASTTYDFVNFDVPGARPGDTYAYGVNNAGQVVGYYIDSSGNYLSFVRNADGTFATFNDPLATYGTLAQNINSSGKIVGSYASGTISSGINTFGFMFNPASGSYTTLGVAGASRGTYAQGINNAGQVVGYSIDDDYNSQGFLLDPASGSYTSLADPDAASIPFESGYATPYVTAAYGINEAGQIVGSYNGIDNSYGFLRGTDGSYTKLHDPLATGSTGAYSINNSGLIAGTYFTCCGGPSKLDGWQGYVLDLASGTYTTIHDPAAQDSRFGDGLTYVYGINDSGQVVGAYSNGVGSSGFIATPQLATVPEPASLAVLAGGVVGLVITRRRRPDLPS